MKIPVRGVDIASSVACGGRDAGVRPMQRRTKSGTMMGTRTLSEHQHFRFIGVYATGDACGHAPGALTGSASRPRATDARVWLLRYCLLVGANARSRLRSALQSGRCCNRTALRAYKAAATAARAAKAEVRFLHQLQPQDGEARFSAALVACGAHRQRRGRAARAAGPARDGCISMRLRPRAGRAAALRTTTSHAPALDY